MNESEIVDAIEKLVYYIKRYSDKNNKDPIEIVKKVKVKSLSSNLLNNKNIISLFNEYTVETIANALKSSIESGRYYKFKIISKLYGSKLDNEQSG